MSLILTRSEYTLAPPPEVPRPANTGDNDVSTDGTPSQFLLLRGLEASVTEEVLAKGVAKLYRPANSQVQGNTTKKGKVASTTGDSNLGARDGSLRRVLLVRDRRSNDSWRYGFAEFATAGVCITLSLVEFQLTSYRTPKPPSRDTIRLRRLRFRPSQCWRAISMLAFLSPSSILLPAPSDSRSVLSITRR